MIAVTLLMLWASVMPHLFRLGSGTFPIGQPISKHAYLPAGGNSYFRFFGDPGGGAKAHPDGAVHVLVALRRQVGGGPVDRSDRGVLVLAIAVQSAQVVAGGI